MRKQRESRCLEVDCILLIAHYDICFEKECNANPVSQLQLVNHGCFSSFVIIVISKEANNSIFYDNLKKFLS